MDGNLHPANQAAVTADGKQIGVIGELHPAVKEHFELTQPVFLFEINIPALLPLMKDKAYRPIPKFPGDGARYCAGSGQRRDTSENPGDDERLFAGNRRGAFRMLFRRTDTGGQEIHGLTG